MAKAINTLGNPFVSTAVVPQKWAMNPMCEKVTPTDPHNLLPEYDYDYALIKYRETGSPIVYHSCRVNTGGVNAAAGLPGATGSPQAGDVGSCCFAMAVDLETSNGLEISGLNAEEQSDISLIVRYSGTQQTAFTYDVFTHVDSMIVLRENNVMELIQ